MIKKSLGYIIAIIGIIILAVGVIAPLRKTVTFIPASITNTYLLIGGAIIAIIGVLLAFSRGSGQKASEVPIYHGKEVVGFRRVVR